MAAPLAAETGFHEAVDLRDGLGLKFHDVIRDTAGDGLSYRFRFVAPQIGGDGFGYADLVDDMERLCTDFALPRVPDPGPQPSRIVITLMSEPTEFGVANPGVVQFFESYSIEGGHCIWEAF